jgi:carbamoyltransferase
MEAGPRALGNRSILANPCDPKIKDKVNKIKLREKWRPLCPSILEEVKEEYMEYPYESPFMILNFKIKKEKLKKIPSVVHVDGTARVQTVSKKINPLFWKLIYEFGKITGEPVVLNTSLNSKGEPIACSPKDAINTFYSTEMDALVLGNFLIEK